MIAAPRLERDIEQAIDLRLGADVDAGGRVLEDVDLRARGAASARPRPSAGCRRRGARSAALGSLGRRPTCAPSSRAGVGSRGPARGSENGLRPAASGLRNRFSRTDEVRHDRLADPVGADEIDAGAPSPARGERDERAAPSSRTRPPVIGSSPNSARPTLSWPAPRSPTSPTISPEWISQSTGPTSSTVTDLARASRGTPSRSGRAAEDLRRLAADDQKDRLLRRGLGRRPARRRRGRRAARPCGRRSRTPRRAGARRRSCRRRARAAGAAP